MLKISFQPGGALPATNVDNSEVIGSSSGNNRKLAKSNFLKPVRKAEEPSFLTLDARQAFTQLRQAFIKTTILRYFNPKRHIRIETDAFGYVIYDVFSWMTLEKSQ